MMRLALAPCFTVLALLVLTACDGDAIPSDGSTTGTEAGPVASVEITPAVPSLTALGELITLTAKAKDEAGRDVAGVGFAWTTSDASVVELSVSSSSSSEAQVKALANGTALITATTTGLSSTASMTVEQQPARIILAPAEAILENPGDTLRISASVRDARSNPMPGIPVTWQVEAGAAGRVDADGLVTAQAFGSATLVATAGNARTTTGLDVIGDRFFLSEGARLRYTLDLPDATGGPFPAIVYIHGSGRADRNRETHATNPLVAEGLAVLRYDKRGVGESTGTYTDLFTTSWRRALTSDAVSAVRFLKRFPKIDSTRIGVMGSSQGGWIGPPAAAETDDITFMLMWSGPTVSVGLEVFYSNLAEGTTTPLDLVYEQLATFNGRAGFNPLPILEGLDIPGLWLYGGMDRSVPTRIDTLNLRHLQTLGKPFDFILYPYANHVLIDVRTNQYVDPWADYVAWLRNKGIL